MSLFSLDGKVAVITGSPKGSRHRRAHGGAGRARGDLVAQGGCLRSSGGVDQSPLWRGARDCHRRQHLVKPALQALVDGAMLLLGGLTHSYSNAASNPYYGPLADISDEQFRKILDNNVLSNHWLIGMVAPQMVARRDGAIIIVSSIGGLRGSPGDWRLQRVEGGGLSACTQLRGGVGAAQCAG